MVDRGHCRKPFTIGFLYSARILKKEWADGSWATVKLGTGRISGYKFKQFFIEFFYMNIMINSTFLKIHIITDTACRTDLSG